MILPEESILQSQGPVPEDLNDWPDFTLTDAKVRIPGSFNYANLLEARADYPLSVTGRLSRLDIQRSKLGTFTLSPRVCSVTDSRSRAVIHPKYTQVQLRINHCTQYAFGQDPSGKSQIWAAGKAGWFEIIPSTRYTPLYDEIVKAIDLVYFLSDAHQKFASRRPVRGAKVEELLVLYQQHTDYRVDDNAEVEAVLEKHHTFLIRQMLEGWEGINWARTHLWSYFSRLYPDEVAQDSTAESEDSEDEDDFQKASIDDDSTDEHRSDRDSDDEKSWTDIISEEIMKMKASGHMCKRYCSVDELAKILVKQCNVTSRDQASSIIKDAANSLLSRLDADPDQGANRTWSRKAIYRQLQRLVDDEQDLQEDESTNGIVISAESLPNRRHQKSILRPSTGAGKGKKRMLRAQSPPEDENEDERELEGPVSSLIDPETPTKKRRLGSSTGNPLRRNLTNESPVSAMVNGPASDLQQEQLDLIRKESMANGRFHINHLEAMIEGLISGRN
jgi:hypothetical protein